MGAAKELDPSTPVSDSGISHQVRFKMLDCFLAHLSRRLIGELIVYEGFSRPSVVRPSVNIFKRHHL